ncbi:unnamed protein product [Aureobasidium uvarum]|uniref:Uncharacterized protein n=1 Tax=Aureobasidium uvarum TaxID=2773716 RepID=A0A9N8PTU5_9PEZI|nr:unnamed protein product [Aureobasidium uvarum]
MSPTLRDLITSGKIGGRCLRQIDHCYQKIDDRDFEVARKILGSAVFQSIHGDQDHDYDVDLSTLARCSFCSSCQRTRLQQVKDYHQELIKCFNDELTASAESRRDSGYDSASERDPEHISAESQQTESQKRKERRTCHPNQLEEYAKKIKDMERETDGFQREITDLKQELENGRKHYQQLEHQHAQMVDYANTEYGKAIAEGNAKSAELEEERRQHEQLKHQHTQTIKHGEAKYAEMFNEAQAKFAELMQKITGLESRNLWIQEQMHNQHTIDQNDLMKMAATIKELNAGLMYCRGEQYKLWLTPTSQHVVNTLEPM